jgi:polyisoprenoid-binding protein YceI
MKRTIIAMSLILAAFTACNDAPEADNAVTSDAQEVNSEAATGGETYTVNAGQSSIEWIGTKPTGQHHGTFKIKDGTLTASNNEVTGGKVNIDVASVQPDDQDAEGNTKLQTHLKSPDFFEVEKYPTGTFEITSVKAGAPTGGDAVMKDATHTVTGNLKLKDQTKSVSFPAKINASGNEIVTDASFNIDRTQWGIVYRSDKSLGDKFIGTDVNIKLHIVAKK